MGGRIFDVLTWTIVGAIIVTVLVTGGGTSVSLAKIFSGSWVNETQVLTGNSPTYKGA